MLFVLSSNIKRPAMILVMSGLCKCRGELLERRFTGSYRMALQLWVGGGGHFVVDTDLEAIQVGQMFEHDDGTWTVEVNDWELKAPNFEAAKALVVQNYDRAKSAF